MEYIIILLEGIITFISPCMLPMLPIYLSYFAGQESTGKSMVKTLLNVFCFILGFTIVYTILGVFSASMGMLLKKYIDMLNIILGIIVILFGLNYIGILNIGIINKGKGIKLKKEPVKYLSSFVFGVIFSITWTPCVGVFLGTALSIITVSGDIIKGATLILTYCLGLGIPFVLSAILIDKLKNTFGIIKENYKIINIICGSFLCIIGILMITGLINRYFTIIS